MIVAVELPSVWSRFLARPASPVKKGLFKSSEEKRGRAVAGMARRFLIL